MIAGLRRFAARFSAFARPESTERQLAREMSAHLALMEDEQVRRGLTPDAARMAARRAFGGVEQAKERHRDERSFRWLEDLRRDVRCAARGLMRAPSFTAAAVITIGLGLGANIAIFGVVYAVLLRPLPFAHPDRLVRISENIPARETPNNRARRVQGLDIRDLVAVKAETTTLPQITAQRLALVSVVGATDGVQRELTGLSAAAMPMLGVAPALGRWFTDDEERPGREFVVVLSDAAWRRYFGGRPDVVGQSIAFHGNTFTTGVALGVSYTVVGVMPASFRFPDERTDFWLPTPLAPLNDGRPRRVQVMARLADDASPAAAARELDRIRRGARQLPPSAADDAQPRFEVTRVADEIGEPVRPALVALMTAVAFVLLIACANVASLLMVRTTARESELALRVAVGADRGRLIRQLLTEGIVLAGIGGVVGVGLAALATTAFRTMAMDMGRVDLGALGNSFPRLAAIELSTPVLLFAAVLSLAAALLMALLPAGSQVRRLRVWTLGARATPGRDTTRRTGVSAHTLLVVVEVALATVLFIGGSLVSRSFLRLTQVDTGYTASNVLTFQVVLPGTRRESELRAMASAVTQRTASLPGVRAVAYANQLPTVALENSLGLSQHPLPPGRPASGADVRLVSQNFFSVLGVRILAGRAFSAEDTPATPRVLILNETLARRDFADQNPVGLTVYVSGSDRPWTIIGIAKDVRQGGLESAPTPSFFVSLEQWDQANVPLFPVGAYYAVRTSVPPLSLVSPVRDAVKALAPDGQLENIATMDQLVANRLRRPRLYAVLLGVFAAVAVVMAAAGIYGVMSYAMTQRTREIGIRRALGATAASVQKRALAASAAIGLIGILIGLAASVALGRLIEGMLYGVTSLDRATYAIVALAFFGITVLAGWIPARRAASINPLDALRHE